MRIAELHVDDDPASSRNLPPLAVSRRTPTGGGAFDLYLREIGKIPYLSASQETRCIELARNGDQDARDQLIKSNLRLVVKLAAEFKHNGGLPFLDLINEGNIGLMKGVNRFDPNRGVPFPTYLHFSIKQAMLQALSTQSRLVRLPGHIVGRMIKFQRYVQEYTGRFNQEPEADQLAEGLRLSLQEINLLRRHAQSPLSLDVRLADEEDGTTLAEMLPDSAHPLPDETLDKIWIFRFIQSLIDTLKPRYADILRIRFGLDGSGQTRTIEEVGRHFGISHQRASKIISLAIEALRDKHGNRLAGELN